VVRSQIQGENSAVLIIEIRGGTMANPHPYIAAAFLCEKVLQEKDEVISAMRIVDRLLYQVQGAPEGTKPIVNLQGLIMFKSGPVTGDHVIKIIGESPKGHRKEIHSLTVKFKGKDEGHNIILNIGLAVEEDGLYWFDLVFDGEVLTRMPITVSRQPTESGKPI
jgi:hypothetical protein